MVDSYSQYQGAHCAKARARQDTHSFAVTQIARNPTAHDRAASLYYAMHQRACASHGSDLYEVQQIARSKSKNAFSIFSPAFLKSYYGVIEYCTDEAPLACGAAQAHGALEYFQDDLQVTPANEYCLLGVLRRYTADAHAIAHTNAQSQFSAQSETAFAVRRQGDNYFFYSPLCAVSEVQCSHSNGTGVLLNALCAAFGAQDGCGETYCTVQFGVFARADDSMSDEEDDACDEQYEKYEEAVIDRDEDDQQENAFSRHTGQESTNHAHRHAQTLSRQVQHTQKHSFFADADLHFTFSTTCETLNVRFDELQDGEYTHSNL